MALDAETRDQLIDTVRRFVTERLRPLEAKGSGQETRPAKTTVTYKQAGGVEIKADVYASPATQPRPAVVWIHGGGLINGHREQLSSQVRDFAFANDYVFVSLDYRLAPETKLPAILTDIEDAMKWLRGEGTKQFNIDPRRIAVTGGSAVDVGGVEEIDAEFEGLLEEGLAVGFVKGPGVAAGAQGAGRGNAVGHASKADAGDFEASLSEVHKLHETSPV